MGIFKKKKRNELTEVINVNENDMATKEKNRVFT